MVSASGMKSRGARSPRVASLIDSLPIGFEEFACHRHHLGKEGLGQVGELPTGHGSTLSLDKSLPQISPRQDVHPSQGAGRASKPPK